MAIKESETLEIVPEDDQADEVLVEYDITTYPSDFTLGGLVGMWNNKDITIPDFQREFVWTIKQSSLLIESFLIGLPVPPVFFYIDDENKNLVIDGQQRVLSIVFFFEGYFGSENIKGNRQIFRLTGLNKKSPFHDKKFSDLDIREKRKLENSVLRAINIRQLSPREENTSVYHIFERLNTGGTPLSPQEIRNCVFRGDFLGKLKILNKDKNWRTIIGKKKADKHQKDVELILRAFGLCNHLNEYEKPMKEFLNKVAKKYKKLNSPKIDTFINDFESTTELISKQLRQKPFSVRGPLNTSIFDSIFCTILNNLKSIPGNLHERYEKLLLDNKFIEYTTLATTDEKIVKERFAYVKSALLSK